MVAVVRRPTRCAPADDVEPFARVDSLSGQMHGAHLVVEDFRRRARQAAEPGVAQPVEKARDGNAERSPRPAHTSSGEKAWTWMPGTARFTARRSAR